MERARRLGLLRLKHFGIDYCDPAKIPEGFVFKKVDLNHQPIPFDDDQFDLVVASHVIEHLGKPLEFFAECARVCKPGGLIYFEAPSERSLLLPGMPFEHDKFFSTSFFDDPTHVSGRGRHSHFTGWQSTILVNHCRSDIELPGNIAYFFQRYSFSPWRLEAENGWRLVVGTPSAGRVLCWLESPSSSTGGRPSVITFLQQIEAVCELLSLT